MRSYLEHSFGRLATFVFDHAKSFLVLMLAMFVVLASGLQYTKLDTSTEGFLHADDPVRIAYNDFKQQFGQDDRILVAVQADDLFSPNNLKKLESLHNALAQRVPFLAAVDSLITSRVTTGDSESLIVNELFEPWPVTAQDYAEVKSTALSNPLLTDLIVNEDGSFTNIMLQMQAFDQPPGNESESLDDLLDLGSSEGADTAAEVPLSDAQKAQIIDAVTQVVAEYDSQGFTIYVAGSPQVTDSLQTMMLDDMLFFVVMVLITIVLFLAVLFRRAPGVALPMLTVMMAVTSTMGVMGHLSIPIQTITQIIPSFLLAVGVGAAIHVLAIFFKQYDASSGNLADKREAIIYTYQHSGFAIAITSLTTAAGLASFATSDVSAVARLGIFASLGVLLLLAYVLLILPALIRLLPIKNKPRASAEKSQNKDLMDTVLHWFSSVSVQYYRSILVGTGVLVIAGVAAITQIEFSHNPLTWLPPENTGRIATEVVDAEMKGSITMEIIIDTGEENGIIQPARLQAMDELAEYAYTLTGDTYFVGKVVSIADVVKEIHQALNENDPAYYVIADNEELIAQEILLFENSGSDDLEDLVDSQFSLARMTVKVPWVDAVEYVDLLDQVMAKSEELFDDQVQVSSTGMIAMLVKTVTSAITSTAVSYGLAFLAIAIMMMVMLGSVKLGLISMIPNLLPVIAVLALMWLLSLPLDMYSMLIGAIVIGLAVDDTVHFMHNFKRYFDQHGDTALAIEQTLQGAGRAMLVTTIVLCAGFFAYFFSAMTNLMAFGVLTSFAIVMALIADFLVAPALMVWLHKAK